MTNDADLDMVASRVSSLESRVASVESQGSPEDAGVEAGQDGAPQPTVDPQGRKIWEAEWRQDYGVLLAYVPDNALVIDGENVEVEADDKDGDEVTVTAGSWYLHVYKNETTGSYEADFDDSATGTRDGEDAKYNIRIFDIHEDGYVEKQYVVGSIVLGNGGVTSLAGDAEGSEVISGDVQISGLLDPEHSESSCGIVVTTASKRKANDVDSERPARVILNLKNRDPSETDWGVHEIKFPNGSGQMTSAHIFSCMDIEIGNNGGGDGGGGGGEDDDEDDTFTEVDVVNEIEFEIKDKKLVAKLIKKKVSVKSVENLSPIDVNVCDVSDLDVVTEEEYSQSSRTFKNKRKHVKVIGTATDATGQTPFTATPHS